MTLYVFLSEKLKHELSQNSLSYELNKSLTVFPGDFQVAYSVTNAVIILIIQVKATV